MLKSPRKPSWRYCDLGRNDIEHRSGIDQDRQARAADTKTSLKRILPGIVISIIALSIVLWLADIRKLLDALRLADYRIVAIGFLFTLLWLIVRSFVWRTLLQEKATLPQTFLTINEGYLLNNLLPFRLGEVGRAFLLSRKAQASGHSDMDIWQVLSTILIERSMDVVLAAGLLLSTLPFVVGASWAQQAAIGAGGLFLAGLVFLYLLARNREWAMQQFEKLATRWTWLANLGKQRLDTFFAGLAVLTDTGRFLRFIALILLNWVVAIFQYYTFLRAFFPETQVLWAAFSLGAMALGVAAPSSPGSVGVLEATIVFSLSVFNLDQSRALAMALTAHLSNYLITGILGAYALAQDGETLTGLYQQLRRIGNKT